MPAIAATGGLGVAPVRVDFAPGAKAAVVTVSNSSDDALDIQIRAMAWSQSDDADVHVPTDDVIVSPPRFALSKRRQQVVRIYLRDPAPRVGERCYRLFVDEIPAPPSAATNGIVRFPVRIMVPMFVAGRDASATALRWSARVDADEVVLGAENQGLTHVRIASLDLAPREDAPMDAPSAYLLYVLPGAARSARLPKPPWLGDRDHSLIVRGEGDAGPFEVRVDVAR